jgi:hypothetical protein
MPRNARVTDPSYELMDDHNGLSIIYRQHGFPCPLVRWHFHKEYELHLIVASSGKVFIGDYIGNFYPQTLFLTGPNLPHNWISQVAEDEVVPKRDGLQQHFQLQPALPAAQGHDAFALPAIGGAAADRAKPGIAAGRNW